jgi:hypothetical protein
MSQGKDGKNRNERKGAKAQRGMKKKMGTGGRETILLVRVHLDTVLKTLFKRARQEKS